jgi:ATP-dependent helicase/nuclease subunit A
MEPSLADDLERTRIKDEIDQSLFVQAGAGSGKTTQIVKRITSLVKHGIPISRIVAITFTEKAAADLRNRVRKSLENAEAEANGNNYFAAALDELDAAPLGTIHSFARRLIAENPIEVGVPPGFEVRSDLASKIDQTAVWASQRELIFQDPDLRADFDLLIGLGVTMKKFEELATVLDTAWDRLPEGVRDAPDDGLGISAFIESANQLVSFINSCSNESDCSCGCGGWSSTSTHLRPSRATAHSRLPCILKRSHASLKTSGPNRTGQTATSPRSEKWESRCWSKPRTCLIL